jgi:L-malate glycosyltransferase
MPLRVHFHTDCPSFAGCENMLANFLNSARFRQEFTVSLSYRTTDAYRIGLAGRTRMDFPVYPVQFAEPTTVLPAPHWMPSMLRHLIRFTSRQCTTYPLLAYEIWKLRKLFATLSPQIVHINNGGYPAALSARAAAIAARMVGVRDIVMVVNNMAEPSRGPVTVLRDLVDRRVVRAVTLFVTGSVAAGAQLRRTLPLCDDQHVALPNGIELRAISETRSQTLLRLGLSQDSGVLFAVVALMAPRKGHRVIIEALARLQRDGPQLSGVTLLLEGDGPLRQDLEAMVRGAGLERHCRFIGAEANVMNLMAAVDVLVLPSISHEDFPNVVLEAMGLGKPVIASRLAGTPEQVDDEHTGLLVPPGDSAALAAALRRLALNPTLREEMGRAGRRRFEKRFTAEVAVRRYAALYHSFTDTDDS